MGSSSSESLTFGVEIKLIADIRGALPPDHEYRKHLSVAKTAFPDTTLKYASQAIKEFLDQRSDLTHPVTLTRKITDQLAPFHEDELQFKAWIIKPNDSIRVGDDGLSDPESPTDAGKAGLFESSDRSQGSGTRNGSGGSDNSVWCAGIEITSPSLKNTEESYNECMKAVKALSQMGFVSFNETCAFHVDVGCRTERFPLLALQKLASLLLVGGEETLECVHPIHRIGNADCPSIRHASFLGKGELLGREPEGAVAQDWLDRCCVPSDSDVFTQLSFIWKAEDVDKLLDMLEAWGGGRLAYDFSGLRPRVDYRESANDDVAWKNDLGPQPSPYRLAIGFRQGDGNVLSTTGHAVAWIKIVTGLVAWALNADEEAFEGVMRNTRENMRAEPRERVSALLINVGVVSSVVETMVY